MNIIDDVKISVCVDCAMLLANGTLGNEDDVEDDAHAWKIATLWPGWVLSTDSGENYFSWSQCDGCGSTLGGDRFDGTAFLPKENFDA